MKNQIYRFIFIPCLIICSVSAAEAIVSTNNTINAHNQEINNKVNKEISGTAIPDNKEKDIKPKLPELDLEPYRQDLEVIKKLQREKLKLELEKDNQEMSKSIGVKNSSGPLVGIYVIETIFTKNRTMARIYVPEKGIVLMSPGGHLTDDIQVVSIGKNNVRVRYKKDKSKMISQIPFFYGKN